MSTRRAWRITVALVAILVIAAGWVATAAKASACPAHAPHHVATKTLGHHRHHAHRHHRRHKPRLDQIRLVPCATVGRIGIWAPAGTCDEPWAFWIVVPR